MSFFNQTFKHNVPKIINTFYALIFTNDCITQTHQALHYILWSILYHASICHLLQNKAASRSHKRQRVLQQKLQALQFEFQQSVHHHLMSSRMTTLHNRTMPKRIDSYFTMHPFVACSRTKKPPVSTNVFFNKNTKLSTLFQRGNN